MTLYKIHAPSSTSLSDDYDDDEEDPAKSSFFASPTSNSLLPAPAKWSSSCRSSRTTKPPMGFVMADLPPEVLIYILSYLPSPKDLVSALRVSRTWCECAVELLWHRPPFAKYATVERMARIFNKPNQTFTYAHFVRRLNFLSLAPDLRDDIFTFFACCTRLERLTLISCNHLSGVVLSRVLPSFPNLVAIDLTGVIDTSDEAIVGLAKSATRLQGINLFGCSNVTDVGVMALATHCPYLRRVKLSGLVQLTDAPISALAKGCPLLLEIDLNRCSLITDVAVRNIWLYSAYMREMHLSYCAKLTDSAFPALPRPEIQTPGPYPFPRPRKDEQDELPPLIISRKFESLRMLDLTACSLITDDAVEGIVSHAPKIRNLVLSKCTLLTDKAVEVICKLGRHLHYLHLGHASKITDRSVRTLARSCTRIRYIDFANCTLLTDMSVFELSALPKLRRIGLVRVSNLTDEAIYSLAERHATLERIHLSYCDQITVMAIHFLLLKLHKLTHLSLTGVPAFRKPELQQYCREAPKEFSSAQRLAFCVYSGKGVSQLRSHLVKLFDRMTDTNLTTDDTEDEDDVFDGEAYHEDTPEPEAEVDSAGNDEPTQALNDISLDHVMSPGTYEHPHHPQSHEFVFQHDRPPPLPAAPSGNARTMPTPGAYLLAATSRLNAQIQAATPIAGPSRRRRAVAQPTRTVADSLPVVEGAHSPGSNSDVTSNRSARTNASNGAGFFRVHNQEEIRSGSVVDVTARSDDGALTPDLNYAEIGHGRGTGMHAMIRDGDSRPHHRPSLNVEVDAAPKARVHTRRQPPPINLQQQRGVSWPYRESTSTSALALSPTTRELHESVQSALMPDVRGRSEVRDLEQEPSLSHGEGRGRSVKRSFRDTLNAAEHYASSLLFGRSSTDVREEASGSGIGTVSRRGANGR